MIFEKSGKIDYDSNNLPGHDMVLILDGKSEQVVHARRKKAFQRKKNPICDCSRSNQRP